MKSYYLRGFSTIPGGARCLPSVLLTCELLVFVFIIWTLPKFKIATEKLPSQKETSLPTIVFSVAMLNFGGVCMIFMNIYDIIHRSIMCCEDRTTCVDTLNIRNGALGEVYHISVHLMNAAFCWHLCENKPGVYLY